MEGKYRATRWGNIHTGETWWGLWFTPKGKRQGMPVSKDSQPVFFATEKEAKAEAKRLNAENATEATR